MDDHTLHLSLSWLMLPLALFLAVLGALSSPRDAQGRPLLLLPDVKAVEEYRRSMSSATAEMQLLDGEIAALIAGQNTDLFTQSRQAQAAFEHALRIAQEVDVQIRSTSPGWSAGNSSRHNLCLPRSGAFSLALGEPA